MQQDTKRKKDGFNLSLARKWKKMSQSDVALLVGMHQTDISDLEKLETIDDEILRKISAAMNVPFDFFTDFDLEKALNSYTVNNTETYTMTSGENSTHTENSQIKQIENETINNNPVDKILELTEKIETYALKLGRLEEVNKQLIKENEQLNKR